MIADAILEAGEHPDSNGRVYRRSADGHNRDRQARSASDLKRQLAGPAPGTDPVGELLRKEARGQCGA
jgi:hypothetical protein